MSRPRVKPEHRPFRLVDGTIRIGGKVYGVAGELADPTGSVWTLLGAMDGTRVADDVVTHVLDRHPDEDPAVVREAVDDLCRTGYVEDAAAPDSDLTDRERERYARGQAFYRWIDLEPRTDPWFVQHRLRAATVTVVGLGGAGGAVAFALAASGVGRLHCVDLDVVELSNLNRQLLYTEADIGQDKVAATVDRLRQVNADIEVTGQRRWIDSPLDIETLAADTDLLVMAADQPDRIRYWANQACLRTGTSWVETGYHGPRVTATPYVPGDGPCYQCVKSGTVELVLPRWPEDQDIAGQRGAVTAASAGMSGFLAAHLVIGLLAGVPRLTPGRCYGYNLLAMEHHTAADLPRRDDCPECGGR